MIKPLPLWSRSFEARANINQNGEGALSAAAGIASTFLPKNGFTMSWDISVYAADSPPPPVEEMPNDWRGATLGTAEEVRRAISACFPSVDWSDPTWGMLDGEQFSFEFNYGEEDPKEGFMIHVRGGGPAVDALLTLAEATGWYLLDCSAGEWFHHIQKPEAEWERFQAYRDKVVGGLNGGK